jgi:hypothetical protein
MLKSCMRILVSLTGNINCYESGNIIFIKNRNNFQDTRTSYNYFIVSVFEVMCDEPKIIFG